MGVQELPAAGLGVQLILCCLAVGWFELVAIACSIHPLREGCPWDQLDMEKRRITVVFNSTGNRFVLHDEWDGPVLTPSCLSKGEAWTGWTFFARRTSSTVPAPVPYSYGWSMLECHPFNCKKQCAGGRDCRRHYSVFPTGGTLNSFSSQGTAVEEILKASNRAVVKGPGEL